MQLGRACAFLISFSLGLVGIESLATSWHRTRHLCIRPCASTTPRIRPLERSMCRASNSSAKAAKVVVLSHMEVVYGRVQEAAGTLSRCLAPVNTA